MRSFAYLTLLSIASALTLVTETDNTDLSGKGLSSLHEGAGINYFFVGSTPQGQELTLEGDYLQFQAGQYPYRVSVEGNILIVGVLEPSPVDVSSGYLSINNNDKFYACKDINDPYNYSKEQYAVSTTKVNDGCVEIKLKVEGDDDTSSSVPSSSSIPPISLPSPIPSSSSIPPISLPSPIPSSSSIPPISLPSPISTGPWSNTTTTEHITVTDYTTYCPEHTTVTITTCEDHKCNPTTITVENPTTLTVTGECLVPTSVPITNSTQVPPTTVQSSSANPTTTVEGVSTFDNSGHKLGGLGGLAIMGALLL